MSKRAIYQGDECEKCATILAINEPRCPNCGHRNGEATTTKRKRVQQQK